MVLYGCVWPFPSMLLFVLFCIISIREHSKYKLCFRAKARPVPSDDVPGLQDPLPPPPATSLTQVDSLSCRAAIQPSPLFFPKRMCQRAFALPTASAQDSSSSSLFNSSILNETCTLHRAPQWHPRVAWMGSEPGPFLLSARALPSVAAVESPSGRYELSFVPRPGWGSFG